MGTGGNESTEIMGTGGKMKVQRVWVLGGNESTNRVDTGGEVMKVQMKLT